MAAGKTVAPSHQGLYCSSTLHSHWTWKEHNKLELNLIYQWSTSPPKLPRNIIIFSAKQTFFLDMFYALAKWTRKSTQCSCRDLRSTCVSFGHPITRACVDLRWLEKTCIDFGPWNQIQSSFSPFGHAMQVDTSWSQVNCIQYAWNLRLLQLAWACEPTCKSVWSSIASSGFANVHRLASTCESVWLLLLLLQNKSSTYFGSGVLAKKSEMSCVK